MAEAYASGATLQEIGDEHSLTRERVRQLLRDAGYDMAELKAKAKRGRRRQLHHVYGEKIRELLTAGWTPTEVAGRLGVPLDLVKRIDGADPGYARRRKVVRQKAISVKYTDEEVLDCLRVANRELGGVLTNAGYTDFARWRSFDDGRPWPMHQTALLRFGSWRTALEAAGLPANASSPVAGRRLFTEGHCIDALLEVERAVGHLPTVAEYDSYAKEMPGILPSSITVRHRFASWQKALRAAADFTESL